MRSTLQIGAPAWIHAATGLPVVHDFRTADVAAGGHGAPLVSLLDAAAQETGRRADVDGTLAAAGTVHQAALAVLLEDDFYRQPLPRTTGREHFHAGYVAERLAAAGVPAPQGADLFATLTELTARTVADAITGSGVTRVVVSGGGVRNPVLMARLAELLPPLRTATDWGLDADAKEAYLFALLGYLSVHGLPGTTPADPADPDGPRATGARLPTVLGSLTPPVPVPRTAALAPVRRLVVAPAGGQIIPVP